MRRVSAVLLLLLASQAVYSRMFIKRLFQEQTDHFGRGFMIQEGSDFTNTVIDTKRPERLFTVENQVKNIKDLTSFLSNKEKFALKDSDIIECKPSHSEVWKFTAVTVALLKVPKKIIELKNSFCYNEVYFELLNFGSDQVTAVITTIGKNSLLCTETYLVSTGKHFHMFTIGLPGIHKFTFQNLNPDELSFIQNEGVRFMRFCDNIIHILPDLLKTAQLFLGGLGLNPNIPFFGSHVPKEMQEANVQFIKEATGFQWRQRSGAFIDLDAKHVQSGDFLAITRFDGLDNIIHWGAGSHSGHSVMALWDRSGEEPELYIVESQDAWYWPTKGLQRTKWADWKKQARNADFNVAILPLRKEFADKFNEDKAWEWFRETQGMPYGYRNFLFGWIDTPNNNLPGIADINFFYLIFRMLEYVDHAATDQLLKEALNWRVGGKDLDLWGVEQAALKQGKSLNDLFAMVEPEGLKYSDGYSYVCSSYVMSYYTKSGMLGDIVTHATEFTPRDVYTLDVFDKNWTRPQECVAADPDLPYCQILGSWKMDLPEYSSVRPYSHMAEKCPTMAPDYFRPEGC